MASEKTASSRTSALDAHVARIDRQDKIATGVLTVIVGLVILLVVSIIAYIVVRGAGRAFAPGFLTNSYNDEAMAGILYQLCLVHCVHVKAADGKFGHFDLAQRTVIQLLTCSLSGI